MRNEEVVKKLEEVFDTRENLYKEHGKAIVAMQEDIQHIKVELAKIVTAYKVFIAIGSAVGVLLGFIIELFVRK